MEQAYAAGSAEQLAGVDRQGQLLVHGDGAGVHATGIASSPTPGANAGHGANPSLQLE